MKNLIGNKVAEKDLREWLSLHGYYGSSAKIEELELHAIQRPGWNQVFRFTVNAKSRDGDWRMLYGCIRDDERYSSLEIRVFWDKGEQLRRLSEWSTGMLTRQSSRSDAVASLPMVALCVTLFFGLGYGILWLLNQLSTG